MNNFNIPYYKESLDIIRNSYSKETNSENLNNFLFSLDCLKKANPELESDIFHIEYNVKNRIKELKNAKQFSRIKFLKKFSTVSIILLVISVLGFSFYKASRPVIDETATNVIPSNSMYDNPKILIQKEILLSTSFSISENKEEIENVKNILNTKFVQNNNTSKFLELFYTQYNIDFSEISNSHIPNFLSLSNNKYVSVFTSDVFEKNNKFYYFQFKELNITFDKTIFKNTILGLDSKSGFIFIIFYNVNSNIIEYAPFIFNEKTNGIEYHRVNVYFEKFIQYFHSNTL